jgi:uncharacterized protein (DUF488 family)
MNRELYTVGHSNQSERQFLDLLLRHGIDAIADVRSVPYSRYTPQFNQDLLKDALRRSGIGYIDLCDELGARRKEPECYVAGAVDYALVPRSPLFIKGIDRLLEQGDLRRVAMMCAERDPLHCHRAILISRHLKALGVDIRHVHGADTVETHQEAELRLLDELGLDACDLFRTREEILDDAYDEQARKIAYRETENRAPSSEALA